MITKRPIIPEAYRNVFRAIIQEVSEKYGLGIDVIIGPSRQRIVVVIRREIAERCKAAIPEATLTQIGWMLGRRDHSTICYLLDKHRDRKPKYLGGPGLKSNPLGLDKRSSYVARRSRVEAS